MFEKIGVGLHYLLIRFTCTNTMVDFPCVATIQLTQMNTMQL